MEEKSYTLLLRLHYKEELKGHAVNVLASGYLNRNANRSGDPEKALDSMRRFRAKMLSF